MHDIAVDVAGDVGQRLAHQLRGDAAGKLDDVDAAPHRTAGLAQELAVFADDHLGQLVVVGLEKLAVAEQDAGPVRRRHGPPGGKRRRGPLAGHIDLRRRRLTDGGDQLRRIGRVQDAPHRRPFPFGPGIADETDNRFGPVGIDFDLGCSRTCHVGLL